MSHDVPMVTVTALSGMPEFVEAALGSRALRVALGEAGLPVNTQVREGFFIPEVSVATFLGSASRQAGDRYLGVMLGPHLDIATSGAWGRYVVEGETLYDCLHRFERALDCFCSYRGFRIHLSGDLAWFRFRFASAGHPDYEQIAFAATGAVTNIIRHYTGPDWLPEIVELDIPRPSSPGAVEAILPIEIRYGADQFGLAIPREFLRLPRHGEGMPALTTLSDARRARSRRSLRSFEAIVAEIVRLQIWSGAASLDAAARSLDLGVRTVQRELGRHGLHFRRLTRRVRMQLARELVAETQLPLSSVARDVGYTNQFNFSRAFTREVGMSPSQFRASSKLQ